MSADAEAAAGGTSHRDAGRTGRQSRRLALVAAAAGVLGLVLDVGAPLPAVVALGGLATALGVRYAGARRPLTAVSSRAVGALGVLVGVAGAVAVAVTGEAGGWYGPLAVGLGAWIAAVATVGTVEGRPAVDRLRALGSTLAVAGALVGVGLLTGATAAVTGSSTVGAFATLVRYLALAVVYGGRPASAVPIVLFLCGVLAATLLVGLSLKPRRVLLSPRADQADVAAIERLTRGLLFCTLGAGVAALVLYVVGLTPAFAGPLAVLMQSVRALLGLCILLGVLAIVAITILPHWPGIERQSVRDVLSTAVAGSLVAVVLVSLVGALATDGTVSVGAGATLSATQLLASVVVLGVVARPVLAASWRVSALFRDVPIRARLGPAALVAGSIGAASTGAVAGVVLGIAASLLLWDALAYRSGLRSEVLGADAAAVERHHLGATTSLLLVGAVAALALYGVTTLVGPVLGGQPLLVVVVGAALLAAVAIVLGQSSRPA